jgi:putative membrane protein
MKELNKLARVPLSAALLVLSSLALGQNVTQQPTVIGNMSGSLTLPAGRQSCACTADRAFLGEAGAAIEAQLASADAATSNTGRADIRSAAASLRSEDRATASRLASIARRAGLRLTPMSRGAATTPHGYSDAAFIATQVESRQRTLALFERESQSGSDASMKAFAQQSLPALRDQLAVLNSLPV